jgi:hypothetical protein
MTNTPPPPLISGVLLPRPPVRAIVDGLARPMSQIPAFPRAENLHIATLLGSPQDIKPPIPAAADVKKPVQRRQKLASPESPSALYP